MKISSKWSLRESKPQPIQLTDEEYEERDRKQKEEEKRIRKQVVMGLLENDPELMQEIIIKLRKRKLNKIKH